MDFFFPIDGFLILKRELSPWGEQGSGLRNTPFGIVLLSPSDRGLTLFTQLPHRLNDIWQT